MINIPIVTLQVRNQEHQVKAGMTLGATLGKLGILPEMVLAVRDGELITEDVILKEGETIRLVEVISGG